MNYYCYHKSIRNRVLLQMTTDKEGWPVVITRNPVMLGEGLACVGEVTGRQCLKRNRRKEHTTHTLTIELTVKRVSSEDPLLALGVLKVSCIR